MEESQDTTLVRDERTAAIDLMNEHRLYEFEKELTGLINKYSLENLTDEPDFVISKYLVKCLKNHAESVNRTKQWHNG